MDQPGPSVVKKRKVLTVKGSNRLTEDETLRFLYESDQESEHFEDSCDEWEEERDEELMGFTPVDAVVDEPHAREVVDSWKIEANGIKNFLFTKKNELLVEPPEDGHPYDYFRMLFDDDIINHVVAETKRYAVDVLFTSGTGPRISEWKDVTALEAGDPLPDDRLFKIRPILDDFNNKMLHTYYPGKNLSLDESMLLWRGRLFFRQYIANKRHKYGLRLYMPSDPNGLGDYHMQ